MTAAAHRVEDQRGGPRDHNLNELFALVRGFGDRLDNTVLKLEKHMDAEEQQNIRTETAINALSTKTADSIRALTTQVEGLSVIVTAFPHIDDGTGDKIPDFRGHRDDHEKRMEDEAEVQRIRKVAKDEFIKRAVLGVCVVLVLGANAYIMSVVSASKRQDEVAAVQAVKSEASRKAEMAELINEVIKQQGKRK